MASPRELWDIRTIVWLFRFSAGPGRLTFTEMKRRLSLAALLVVIAGVVLLSHSRRSNDSAPNQTPAIVSSDGAAIVAPIEPAAKGRTVVIQTGAARLANAVLSMSNMVSWVNQLDAVHASDKPILMRWAGQPHNRWSERFPGFLSKDSLALVCKCQPIFSDCALGVAR